MYDVVALGDTLIDFTPMEVSGSFNPVYETNVGGTIANFAASSARMGLSALIVSRVGSDDLGHFCEKILKDRKVDTSQLSFDETHFTTLSFVTLKAGERSFFFSRRHAADIRLDISQIDMNKVLDTRVIHVSGMSFTDEPIRSTAFSVMKAAKEQGKIITLDINYREQLWSSAEEFKKVMRDVISYVTVVKGSEEESLLLTGKDDYIEISDEFLALGAELVVISAGPKGAFFRCAEKTGNMNTYDTVRVDTTGAGDCFMGGLIYSFIQKTKQGQPYLSDIEQTIDFANAAGATSISKRGGVASAPTVEMVSLCQKNEKKLEIPW